MSTALQKPAASAVTIKDMLVSDKIKAQVAKALPRHVTADRMIRAAITAMTKSPKLSLCTQPSFFGALLTLSQLGIEPDGRRAHLIPFENKKRRRFEVQLIIDYKGLIELVLRSGLVATIGAQVVCENDEFAWDRGEVTAHKIDWRKSRGSVYAVYAMARMKSGEIVYDVMTRDDVEAVRKRSRAGHDGPWVTDWNEMAKKTVLRRLCKLMPQSAEIRDALATDEASDRSVILATPIGNDEVSLVESGDAEVTETPPAQVAESKATDNSSVDEDDGDLAPAKTPEPKAESKPAEPVVSSREQLTALVLGEGHNWERFHAFIVAQKWFDKADLWTGFEDVSEDQAKRIIGAKRGLIMGLNTAMAKEGAK